MVTPQNDKHAKNKVELAVLKNTVFAIPCWPHGTTT
jgi:hypothetical protein